MNNDKIIITSPSLNPEENVSGISEVVRFIIANNQKHEYIHFEIGKKDNEKGRILQRVLRIVKTYRNWRQFLNEHPEALVHYNFPLDSKSVIRDYFFIKYAIKHNRRMLAHIHGGLYLTKKNRPRFINRMMQQIFSWEIQFAVLSDLEKKIIEDEFHAKHVSVLPNCVDLSDAQTFNRTCKKKGEPLTIGYLGRIEENKGISWLLLAAEKLLSKGMKSRLVLAGKENGNNGYVEKFSQLLGDSFHYCGVVSGVSKRKFLRDLDVFVLPSYFEGLPMSLLETMSYGCVPVTTPVGSIPEVVRDGENGLIIKTKDERSIVEALDRLNKNRNLLQCLSENARQTIFTKFSPKEYINHLNLLYES